MRHAKPDCINSAYTPGNGSWLSEKTMDTTYCRTGIGSVASDHDLLVASFRSVGKTFGFEDVEARFTPFKEFKSCWYRSGKSVTFEISDYLKGADQEVLVDFAQSLFSRVALKGEREIYTDRMRSWLESPAFLRRNQPLYLKRSRNLSLTHEGEVYDLQDAYLKLKDQGLVHDCRDAVFNWTKRGNRLRVGYCSVLMKVVAISSIMDSEKVPDFVHEYVLYHEILHLEEGLKSGNRHHTDEFREAERQHPRWAESEAWLKRLAFKRP